MGLVRPSAVPGRDPDGKPVTAFYDCLWGDDGELGKFIEDPWAYVLGIGPDGSEVSPGICTAELEEIDGEILKLNLTFEQRRQLVLSMDEGQIRAALVQEGNPPESSRLEARRLLKEVPA